MVEINLFPWREYRHKILRQQFYINAIGIIISTCIVITILFQHNVKKTQEQLAINNFYQHRVLKLKNELHLQQKDAELRQKWLSYLEILNQVHDNKAIVIDFINGMVQILPDSGYYTSISFTNDKFLLEGRAQSNTNLASMLENIKVKGWQLQVDDSKITEKVEQDIFSVWFRFQIIIPTA